MSNVERNIRIDPAQIRRTSKAQGTATVSRGFDEFLGAAGAMEGFTTELTRQATGRDNAAAVLHGAFSGFMGASGSYGYGPASGAGYGGFGAYSEYPGMMGTGAYNTVGGWRHTQNSPTTPGAAPTGSNPNDPANYTGTLINSMNTNNLRLLELQSIMQSNMQAWNTKSNILSADHRARMALIEKFTARG